MVKIGFTRSLLMSVVLGSLVLSCSGEGKPAATVLPDYPVRGGVSAPVAGFLGDRLVLGGGCNFPGVAAADGGQKVYYADSYITDVTAGSPVWQSAGPLPEPLAYGAFAESTDGLVWAGGLGPDSAARRVLLVRESGDSISLVRLPDLPVAIDNGAAAAVGNDVYVAGGNQQDGGNGLYVLRNGATAWVRLADCPSGPRVQPVLLYAGGRLYLAGGFAYDAATNSCTLHSDMLPYCLETGKWEAPVPFPRKPDGTPYALSGGAGVVCDGSLYLTGGVDYRIFKDAMEGRAPADYMRRPADWYRFNSDVLRYRPDKGIWEIAPEVKGMDKAGGVLLCRNRCLYMAVGETKPGIRTSEVVVQPIDSLHFSSVR